MFPGWINGWNIMTAPPKGSSINNLLKESKYDNFAIFRIMSNIISNIMGIKSSCEITQTTIIKTVEINLILPSKLCMGLSFDAKSSKRIICVISTIVIYYNIELIIFLYFSMIIKKSKKIEIKFVNFYF